MPRRFLSLAGGSGEGRTGVSDVFNIQLEYTPDEHTPIKIPDPRLQVDPASSIPRAGSIFAALQQQLGLQLTEANEMQESIAIDSVQRPLN